MNRRKFLGWSVAGGAALVSGDMLVEAQRLEVTNHRVAIGPSSDTSLSMVQITDLHIQRFGRHERNIVEAANDPRPDFMVITGDSIDDRSKLGVLGEFLSQLTPGIPKFAILGNWEHWAGVDILPLAALYAKHNCKLLVDRAVTLEMRGKRIRLAGLDDLIGAPIHTRKSLDDVSPVDGELILAHCPGHRDILLDRNSVMISGHTHGGQVNLGPLYYTPNGSGAYLRGWYRSNTLFVSRGLGTSRFPLRLNSVPELARFELVV